MSPTPQVLQTRQLLKDLETARNSKVLAYVASTRNNSAYTMNQMDTRIIYDHLSSIGKVNKIDLFMHSFGGDVTFSWRLVNLVKEFCNEFNVIVPLHTFSTATLISLGADSIIMLPSACLGPTDPQSNSSYNALPIDVEDISSYVDFIKNDFDIKSEEGLIESLKLISKSDARIHPLALGHAKRGSKLAQKYAKDLLMSHVKNKIKREMVEKIVKIFSSELFAHDHPINRVEAKKHGLKVLKESASTEGLIWKLFNAYETEMSLKDDFDPIAEFKKITPALPITLLNNLQPVQQTIPSVKALTIESAKLKDVCEHSFDVTGIKFLDGNGDIKENYSWIRRQISWSRI